MKWEELEYERGNAWKLAQALFTKFVEGKDTADVPRFVWRGEPQQYPSGILPSLDREDTTPVNADDDLCERERHWYGHWRYEMHALMDNKHVDWSRDVCDDPEWLAFACHHGCQTRLVDWTRSPWVALYFACSTDYDKDARIWCFDERALLAKLQEQWNLDYNPSKQGDWNLQVLRRSFDTVVRRLPSDKEPAPIVATLDVDRAPSRMSAQLGLFTIASARGVPHDELLADLIPEENRFQVLIPGHRYDPYADGRTDGGLKKGLLGILRDLGVHHESLRYPMLDVTSRCVAASFRGQQH
jgi:hypothetical protein